MAAPTKQPITRRRCKACGELMDPRAWEKPSHYKKRKYCSQDCSTAGRASSKNVSRETRYCLQCKKEIPKGNRTWGEYERRKFCSNNNKCKSQFERAASDKARQGAALEAKAKAQVEAGPDVPRPDCPTWEQEVEYFGDGFLEWRERIKASRGFDPCGFYELILSGEFLVNAEDIGGEGKIGITNFYPMRSQCDLYRDIIWHRWAATDDVGWKRYQEVHPAAEKRPAGRFTSLRLKYRRAYVTTSYSIFVVAEGTVNRGCNSVITAHSGEGLDNVSEIVRTAMGRTKKGTGIKRMAQRQFETSNDSVIRLLGGNDSLARGWGLLHLGWTEADYTSNLERGLDSALPSVNKGPFATVMVESTPRADAATDFKDWVSRTARGETVYRVSFLSWLDDEMARVTPTEEERAAIEAGEPVTGSDGYEDRLREWELPVEQIAWWRRRFQEDARSSLNAMTEIYPATLEEALDSSTGVEFFHVESMAFHRSQIKEPVQRRRVRFDSIETIDNPAEWLNNPHMAVWELPLGARRYVIGADGADAAMRKEHEVGSECYATVWDLQVGEQVAELHGHMNAQDFAIALWRMAKFYHAALVVPEKNACAAVIDYLVNTLQYGNVYERESFGAVVEKYSGVYGFDTRSQSRPILVQRLQDNVNRKTVLIRSRYLLGQLENFGKRRGAPNKQMARSGEKCDDGPISMGLAMFGHDNAINGAWQSKDVMDHGVEQRVTVDNTRRAQEARARYDDEEDEPDWSEADAILLRT